MLDAEHRAQGTGPSCLKHDSSSETEPGADSGDEAKAETGEKVAFDERQEKYGGKVFLPAFLCRIFLPVSTFSSSPLSAPGVSVNFVPSLIINQQLTFAFQF